MEIVVGIASIVASIGIYLAGRWHGEKLERKAHERSLEESRRLRELCSRAADEFKTCVKNVAKAVRESGGLRKSHAT